MGLGHGLLVEDAVSSDVVFSPVENFGGDERVIVEDEFGVNQVAYGLLHASAQGVDDCLIAGAGLVAIDDDAHTLGGQQGLWPRPLGPAGPGLGNHDGQGGERHLSDLQPTTGLCVGPIHGWPPRMILSSVGCTPSTKP